MAAFMEESGIEARNGHSYSQESFWAHLGKPPFSPGPVPHHELRGRQLRNSLTEGRRLAGNRNVCLARTATKKESLKRGGGAAMR
ncbi:MAG: hypothetical protein ACYSYV_04270 [Planctomycetota bacterium]